MINFLTTLFKPHKWKIIETHKLYEFDDENNKLTVGVAFILQSSKTGDLKKVQYGWN